jgi:hypothetical protein
METPNTPSTPNTPTEIAPTPINIAYPAIDDPNIRIAVGACRLNITPGDGEAWVTGMYSDPSGALPLEIIQEGGGVKITQRQNFADMVRLFERAPRLDLVLGKGRPYSLTLETGASENFLELGGLSLRRMTIRQGAGKVEVSFSAPNPIEMGSFEISSGASSIEIKNLLNAGFTDFRAEGGAAAYKFHFGGELRRNANARITNGMSSVEIIIPPPTPARIDAEAVMGSLDVGDGFATREGAYWTMAAPAAGGALLSIRASVTLGSLRLRTM